MTLSARQIHAMTAAETRLATVSFRSVLSSGELLTGTPTVAEVGTADLTISNVAVNTTAVAASDIFPDGVSVGQAVQFLVSGGVAGTTYSIRVSATTDATPAQTLRRRVTIRVVTD